MVEDRDVANVHRKIPIFTSRLTQNFNDSFCSKFFVTASAVTSAVPWIIIPTSSSGTTTPVRLRQGVFLRRRFSAAMPYV